MKSGSWDKTVTIELGGKSKTYARISTTRGAAYYLLDQWPGSRDHAYKQAIVSCTKALKGEANDEAAFASFVQAAIVSGLEYTSAPSDTPYDLEQEIARALTHSMMNDMRSPSQ
ncbi:Protein of unknown function [Rhizobium sp. RU33A]|uniref:DUF982 domain-containing protein n=1 Tax=Rhizobium sp. RU33A TaxID=1907413 RepID=UPI000955A14B|nr:DUF982 domain-containing protein [Rhizobium sp. RU33A]SIR15083.1 Protein of unknown function [Rhizobium sp. RU33A]